MPCMRDHIAIAFGRVGREVDRASDCCLKVKLDRLILQMDDVELEQFCRQWVERKSDDYIEVKRFGGAGDKGRDVVGFCSPERHAGNWDNYQCKQYRDKLGKGKGLLAVGKVLYWASQGEFAPPRRFIFVAPKGLNSNLLKLINKPQSFKAELIASWDLHCAKAIVQNQEIKLEGDVLGTVDGYGFTAISYVDVDDMLADPTAKPLLFELFGEDPGDFPRGTVPIDVQAHELAYLDALLGAYNDREGGSFSNHQDVFDHGEHGEDLRLQRTRFYEAEGFQKFYRDNTSPETIARFRHDIRLGIHDTLKKPAPDELRRVEAAMSQAANLQPGGPLARYAYIPVKQGICHHLVNDGVIDWKGSK